MRPLQLWRPARTHSLALPATQRDMQRAFIAGDGAPLVWLLPDIPQVYTWQDDESPLGQRLAIPAEELEGLAIYHINATGEVWGLGWNKVFPTGNVLDLLDTWLTLDSHDKKIFALHPQQRPISMNRPFLREIPGTEKIDVVYKKVEVPGRIYSSAPLLPHMQSFAWPAIPTPVSLEAESSRMASHKQLSPPLCIAIHAAGISELFDTAVSWDVLYHHYLMVDIAGKSQQDREKALVQARTLAAPFVTEGQAPQFYVNFLPTFFQGHGVETALSEAQQLGASSKKFDNAWRAWAQQSIPVTRVWGGIGLLWALLIERLEDGQSWQICQRCGRVLQGQKHRRFCHGKDNRTCWNARRTADKRRERRTKSR